MPQRFLHPAPPDYGIVELREAGKSDRFLVFHLGHEFCACASLEQASAVAACHRDHQRPLSLPVQSALPNSLC